MRTLVLEEIGIDERCHSSAQHLILVDIPCLKDLEPCFEIRIANENGRILLAVSRTVQEPTLVGIRVLRMQTCIQALDKVSDEMIVDPRAIIFTKKEPGLALRIPDDVLPVTAGSGDEQGPL